VEAWTATKQAKGTWLFEWDATSGESFFIWLDGELLDTVDDGEYECTETDYDDAPPPLEIMLDESGAVAENDAYPPYAILQWRGVTGASGYVVEKMISGSWITQREITEASVGYYFHKTQPLEDNTSYSFQVSALDVNGNAGTPISFTVRLARNPAPPGVTLTIDGSNDLVVGAA